MLRRFIVGSYRAGRKAARTFVQRSISHLKRQASPSTTSPQTKATDDAPVSHRLGRPAQKPTQRMSPAMQDILAERLTVLEQIGWSAEQGMVPDGQPRRLLSNHEAELTEHRRLLTEDRLALQAGLRRLAALFPPPAAPEPEPPVPPRRRDFSPLGDLLAQRRKSRLN